MLLLALLDAGEEEEADGLWELEAEGTAEEEWLGEDEAVELALGESKGVNVDVPQGVGYPLGVSEGVAPEDGVFSPGPLGVTLVVPEAPTINDEVGGKGVPDTEPVERWWVGVALPTLPAADLVGGA